MTDTLWEQRGLALAREHRLQQFAIADWIVEGVEALGVTPSYDYAEQLFPQYTRTTLQQWVYVAKRFPFSIRIESDHLTFGHYQAVIGAEKDPFGNDDSKTQIARELVWIRQADERNLSVSALRDAINRAFELRREAFLEDHSELKPKESEPEPEPRPKAKQKDAYGSDVQELKTPWLSGLQGKRMRFQLDELARARCVRTEQLLVRIIQDFLDAHTDEIGDAERAAKKREAEHDAQMQAAEETDKLRRDANAKRKEQLEAKKRAEEDERKLQAALRERERQKNFLMDALKEEWKEEVTQPFNLDDWWKEEGATV